MMLVMSNEIRLDVGSSPALAAMFSGKQPGDECEVTIAFVMKDSANETIRGTITKVYIEEDGENPEVEAEPNSDEPIMVTVIKKSEKKSE